MLVLGYIVYNGIRTVDYVNRGLLFSKLGIYLFLVAVTLFYISPLNLAGGQFKFVTTSFTVMLTSFGFANIVPSLRAYFHDDAKKLHKAILIGSLIPLVCYIFWDLAIMGVIARDGNQGLVAMLHSSRSTSGLMNQLSSNLNMTSFTTMARIFTSICLATSFLGVSLSLFDFFADGLRIHKEGMGKRFLYAVTFFPPLVIVLVDPGIFIKALSYAGIYCMILLVLMPALMAWRGRYQQKIEATYQVWGGKYLLAFLIFISVVVIITGILQSFKI
jgi:tyrosine-specific transport protein